MSVSGRKTSLSGNRAGASKSVKGQDSSKKTKKSRKFKKSFKAKNQNKFKINTKKTIKNASDVRKQKIQTKFIDSDYLNRPTSKELFFALYREEEKAKRQKNYIQQKMGELRKQTKELFYFGCGVTSFGGGYLALFPNQPDISIAFFGFIAIIGVTLIGSSPLHYLRRKHEFETELASVDGRLTMIRKQHENEMGG